MKNQKIIYSKTRGNQKTRLMLNLFGKNQNKDVDSILKIKNWVRKTFELTEYDIGKTVAAMKRKKIPEVFIERIQAAQELTGKAKDIVCAC